MSDSLDARQTEQKRLIEEAAALESLEGAPGYQVWQRYASEFLHAHQALLAGGGITDIGEYRMIAGRVQGITQLLELPRFVSQARDRAMMPDENYQDPLADLDVYPLTSEEPDAA